MPRIKVREQIQINADAAEVYVYLCDFQRWPEWSPWLVCEPDCDLSFEEKAYAWEGKVVGSGKMTLIHEEQDQCLRYNLKFLKPWKSHAAVQFQLIANEHGTSLVWSMMSRLPWFMFWIKPMMQRMLSMDYQRGLRMLKQKLETGTIDSQLSFSQSEALQGCHYIGIERTCSIEDMDSAMATDFKRLMELPLKNKLPYDSSQLHTIPFTIYRKWKLGKGLVCYTCAIPIEEKLQHIAQLPFETVSGYRPPCNAFVVTHTGDYQHLGNAWAAAMSRAKNKVIPQSSKNMPFEIYVSSPACDGDLITKVCVPLKN